MERKRHFKFLNKNNGKMQMNNQKQDYIWDFIKIHKKDYRIWQPTN